MQHFFAISLQLRCLSQISLCSAFKYQTVFDENYAPQAIYISWNFELHLITDIMLHVTNLSMTDQNRINHHPSVTNIPNNQIKKS